MEALFKVDFILRSMLTSAFRIILNNFCRYKGDNVINYSQRGGISVVTEKQTRTSRLLISRALPADSGNYTCAPSTAESASVLVHVLNGG